CDVENVYPIQSWVLVAPVYVSYCCALLVDPAAGNTPSAMTARLLFPPPVGAVIKATGVPEGVTSTRPVAVGFTVMRTVAAVLERLPSFTTRLKTRSVEVVTVGAVKVGFCAVVLERVTTGPDVCDQRYVMGSPFGSVDPEPSSATAAPGWTT